MVKKIHLQEQEKANYNLIQEVVGEIKQILQNYGLYIEDIGKLTYFLNSGSNDFEITIKSNTNEYYLQFDLSSKKANIFAVYKGKFIISNYGISIQQKEIANLQEAVIDLRRYLLGYIQQIF